jgi:methyltransferase FkbM-like protein
MGILNFLNLIKHKYAMSNGAHNDLIRDRELMILGRMASWEIQQRRKIDTLKDIEFRLYSQWGEDGIVEWLVQNIPIEEKSFIEFGVENYKEANTRFLLQNHNWKGLVLDGNQEYMDSIRKEELFWKYDLTAKSAFITIENINELIEKNGFIGDIGLLSVDIDGNDYWVLKAIDIVKPCILVCEYNPIFGDLNAITVPYHSDFTRFNAHYSGLYFGASIGAIRFAAENKGYKFVGTCSNGINAFFVRDDLFIHVETLIGDIRAYPSRHRDSRDRSGNLSFASGVDRLNLIKNMPVINVENDTEVRLSELGDLYSEEWLSCM